MTTQLPKIINDPEASITLMHQVGTWMKQSGLNPSKWWNPQNMNREFLSQHIEPDEYFVAIVDGQPAASFILQDTERNQSWAYIDKDNPQQSLYIHWLCVGRQFTGQGLPTQLVEFAKQLAKERELDHIRADTNADESKLRQIYQDLGFELAGIEKEDDRNTAYYQIKLT